jgi:hypothetical protein
MSVAANYAEHGRCEFPIGKVIRLFSRTFESLGALVCFSTILDFENR